MAVTYTWNVNTMDAAPSEDGLTDVVKVVHWRLTASDGVHSVDAYSTVSLDSPDPEHYTAFADLTQEQVISWVESRLDVDSLKSNLETQLQNLANPPIVTLQGPWAANT